MFSCTPTSRLQIHFSSFSPITTLLHLSFDTIIKIFFNLFFFKNLPCCSREKHFSCLPLKLCLIVISAKPSIDLLDKSRKLSQIFKIFISWVLIRFWYLILEALPHGG